MSKQDPKTKQELLDENGELRRRIAELEHLEGMRRKADVPLADTQERYRRILESVADYIYTVSVENGHALDTFHGPACVAVTGYTSEEFAADPYLWFRMVDERDRQAVTEQARQVLAGRTVAPLEHRIIRKDGSTRWVSNTTVLHFDAEGNLRSYDGIIRDITERKQAEEELQSREAKLRSIFLAAPVGIGTAVNRVIREVNDRLCEMVGYAREELLGRNSRMLYPTEADYDYVGRVKYERIRQRGTGTVETRWRRKDGSIIDILLSSTPLDSNDLSAGVTFTALDITDRRRMEESLRLTQFSVDHASDAAFWIGPDARFLYVSEAACRSLGYTRDELLNLSVPDIDPSFPRERWPSHWQEIRERKSFSFESVHRRKDGSVFPVELTVNHLEFGGKEYNFAFARDLTERKRAEEERRKLEAQIQHAQKLESLGLLAGGIAHDFNNLLTAILGHADLALTEMSIESPGRASLAEIAKAAHRAADLCKQMLAYAGKGRFVVEPINLTRLVEEMTHMLEISISKKATIQYHSEPKLPAIDADATQIRQVIMNLIVNASEALGDRPGVISVSTGVTDCDPKYLAGTYLGEQLREGRYVFLEVADTGCGMDRETVGRIFDPFFSTKFAGRGLGLAAVLGIVRGHKGAIKVYSEPHRGTTFRILFPASDRTASETRRESRPVETWRGRGSLLIVDDEEPVRIIAKRMAEHLGFTVLTASNGREAIEIFRKHRKDIVCVLLDLTMPQMDGEETFQELKRIHPGVRVILSSGYGEHDLAGRFTGRGLAGFIQKPYQLNTLTERLKQATEP